MPNQLTTVQLEAAKAMIAEGRVVDFYNYMAAQGYGYANLAKGVVECTVPSGGSTAQAYMVIRASEMGVTLTTEKVVAVEKEMANRYVDTLIELSRKNDAGGVVSRDWNYQEALDGHAAGFRAQGLPETLWTLYPPSQVLSPEQLEANWQRSIDPGQTSWFDPALNFTFGFSKDMSIAGTIAALSGNGGTALAVADWSARVTAAQATGVAAANGYGAAAAGCSAGASIAITRMHAVAESSYARDAITPPEDLGTSTRDSASFVGIGSDANSVTLLAGGTISDLWLLQKNSGNAFSLDEFGQAILANNPDIQNVNLVPAGQTIYVPQKQADGSVTYRYPGGSSINSNSVNGEYHMIIPAADGSGRLTIYERIVDGEAGYVTRQTQLDVAGDVIFASLGFQATLSSDVQNLSTFTLNGSGNYDAATQVGSSLVTFSAEYDPTEQSFRASEIQRVNGSVVEDDGLTADDLAAIGLGVPGAQTGGVRQLIDGIDPVETQSNGWSAPIPIESSTPEGFTRTLEFGNGLTVASTYDSDRRLVSVTESYSPNSFEEQRRTFQVNADGTRVLVTQGTRMIGSDGSYIGTETDMATRQVYRISGDADGNNARVLDVDGTNALQMRDTATVFSDVSGFVNAIRSGQPVPLFASGIRLVNDLSTAAGAQNTNLAAANNVAAGVLSFYNLYNAFNSGSDFERLNSSLTAFNYANEAWGIAGGTGGAASNFLNGTAEGLAGGSVGVLPMIGLVASIKAEDPIGIAMSLGTLVQGAAFLTTPVGWALIAASLLKAIFSDDSPPDAWGIAKVTFGDGFNNVDPLVQASGENFGTDRAKQQLQGVVDVISQIIANNNQAASDSSQFLGLIPQRMPGLTYRAAEFDDEGYAVNDVDPLTGAQRIPFLRFDDSGQPFGFTPEDLSPEERAMLTVPGTGASPLVAYMLNSALQRGAIAPMWEVRTAKMQEQAGEPNAGLTEEERAAKAGLAAMIDTQYAASHTSDPQAKNRRVGHFMAVGLDLGGDGRISTRTVSQIHAAGQTITFDWDAQGYQKKTGWIGPDDGFLMLDQNFNQSADQAKELLSNPLIADAGKGLRILAAYDANGDGRIDASDPVYSQLKVWQDLNQDGNNTHTVTVNTVTSLAQDEQGGVRELRGLQEAGITAIDYANGRFERSDGSDRLIQTETLEAEAEGTRYTPAGAGIQIKGSNGAPQIVVTQVLSEAAVYEGLQISASGETIGTPGAELFEDGVPTPYDPDSQGGPIEIVISSAQLLQNDTWAGEAGAEAGLRVVSVRAGAHTAVSIRPDGDIRLSLAANYSGPAEFFYTVAEPGYEAVVAPREARVGLNITPVNDGPVVNQAYSPDRPVYGYTPQAYTHTYLVGNGEDAYNESLTGTIAGAPIYTPYIEHVPEEPIYEWRWAGSGEDMYQEQVQVGSIPAHDVAHESAIAHERANTGQIHASDADGGNFSYQVIGQATYGTATVNANGEWNYVGRRPKPFHVPDLTGDGAQDWLRNGMVYTDGAYTSSIFDAERDEPNMDSNAHIGAETESFLDYFTVRVIDNSDPSGQTFRDVEIEATHYGPAPLPVVADSGGKKPIAIDLDGDGFHFIDVDDSNVFFEVNGEGWKRRIAWTEPGDGLLAYDKDGNGRIDRSDELSFIPYAPGQQTDMAALRAAFDANGDGRFDAADPCWSSFGVWQDANSNGITDAGELRGLEEMGITSIDLTTDGQFQVIDGQTVHGIGNAMLANGTSLAVADVTLRYTNETKIVTVNPDGTSSTTTTVTPGNAPGQDFEGTPDKDLVFGTKGSDRFRMHESDDVVVDDGGNDVVEAGAGNDQVFTGMDDDVVYGGDGDDSIYTGAGTDLVFGDGAGESGNDVILLEDGNDIAFGGLGNDFISGGLGNDVISGNAGDDKLFGEAGWDAIFGQEGDDELYGMDGNDMLDGGNGNDLLGGGAGDDSMEGGAGDDTYQVDASGDTVIEAAGGGNDTVAANITYTLGAEVENLRLVGEAANSGTGNGRANLLVGNAGNNSLWGLGGNDTLDGGLGSDTLRGGTGADTYVIESSGDKVIESAGEGNDTVRSRITTTLSANVENLTLVGIAAIDGTGNGLDNTLVGNIAANVLDGGAGADVMRGGRGDDRYVVDNAGDVLTEQAGEGIDGAVASVSYTLSANIENLSLAGVAVAATGNELNNMLTGNGTANILDGRAGADTMAGGSGDDTYVVDSTGDVIVEKAAEGNDTVRASTDHGLAANIENLQLTGGARSGIGNALDNSLLGNGQANRLDGGEGSDTMVGGAGDDIYVVDDVGDIVIELQAEGTDTVLSAVSYTAGANVENLTLVGAANLAASGNTLANSLTGNGGNNMLDGGAGADLLAGAGGDDIYRVDNSEDTVLEQVDAGNDSVVASVSYGLSANVENLTLISSALEGTGNELDNVLVGNAQANVLDGGRGVDQMRGQGGDDTYVVDATTDVAIEEADAGDDTVIASANYTLGANIESLTLVGTANLTGRGNDLANLLRGNVGANTLDGAAGSDQMSGAGGDDTYVVDDVADVATERAGEGIDTVRAAVTYTLDDNIENLVLTGTAAIDGYGNELDNTLTGNGAANLLDGGIGGDAMAAGAGDDSYIVDDARDLVQEWFASGHDTVLSGINYVLPENVEVLRLTGTAVSGTGNDLGNTIVGNQLDNFLDGAAGADQMSGNTGNDTYIVDDMGDATFEAAGAGTDRVIASVSHALADQVENLVLVGTEDLAGTGNALDNVIRGNAGSNRIDGGAGADTMIGAAGDDRYFVDDSADIVTESSGEGDDTIESSVSYTLSGNVETLVLTQAAIQGGGNDLDNLLVGNAMDNLLDGATGADRMQGGLGDDEYIVENAGDAVTEAADEGHDTVRSSVAYALAENVEDLVLTGSADIAGTGNALDNMIVGNSGGNALDGGLGNDTYVYQAGGGLDQITDVGGVDTVQFGAGFTLDNIALRIALVDGQKIARVRVLDSDGNELAGQGFDYVMLADAQNRLSSPIETFLFADGNRYEWHELLVQSTDLAGTRDSDLLIGGRSDDAMDGGRGDDAMYGGSGEDAVEGGDGADILYGFNGNDSLYGGNDGDELYGGAGDDQLSGQNGADYLLDRRGTNVLDGGNHDDILQGGMDTDHIDGGTGSDVVDGGAGADLLLGSAGDDWVAAGSGNDAIDTGSGRNLVAFNRGDGVDTLTGVGRDVLSLGGGIRYADLRLTKNGKDLVLNVGEGESITLRDWYLGSKTKPVDVLQMITARGDYDPASADSLRNRQVEVFDFISIVRSFDAARAADVANVDGWSVMNSMLDAHLQGSDSAALGGDLSFQYGASGGLSGLGLGAAQAAVSAGSASWQVLKPRSELEGGPVTLA